MLCVVSPFLLQWVTSATKPVQLLPFFDLNRQGQISHYNINNIIFSIYFLTLCLVYIILILVYIDRGSVIWGELEEAGKWGFEEFSILGKWKRGNLWSGVCLVCGKVLVFKAVFGRRFEMGFFSTILGFCGFGFGISIGLVAGYFLFIYFQPIDVEVPLYLSVSFWMFLCMYGHVLWKIFGLVCVVLIKIVTFFFLVYLVIGCSYRF